MPHLKHFLKAKNFIHLFSHRSGKKPDLEYPPAFVYRSHNNCLVTLLPSQVTAENIRGKEANSYGLGPSPGQSSGSFYGYSRILQPRKEKGSLLLFLQCL